MPECSGCYNSENRYRIEPIKINVDGTCQKINPEAFLLFGGSNHTLYRDPVFADYYLNINE
jgi:hypothetical protein